MSDLEVTKAELVVQGATLASSIEVRKLRHTLEIHIPQSRGDGEKHTYTNDELDMMASMAQVPISKLSDIGHWAILYDAAGQLYVLTINGYRHIGAMRGVMYNIQHALAAFPQHVVSFHKLEVHYGKPKVKALSQDEFLANFGMPIEKATSQYDVDFGFYNKESRALVLGAGRRAPEHAAEDKSVDRWMRALAGSRYPQLVQWSVQAASKPMAAYIPALVMSGAARAGKDSFRKSIARLWTNGGEGTAFDVATDQSNTQGIEKSPVVYIEEELRVGNYSSADPFAAFKTAVVANTRKTNAKWQHIGAIEGYWRIFVTVNSFDSILRRTNKNQDNVKAAMSRMLCVPIEESPELLAARRELGLMDTTIEDGFEAEHFETIYKRIAGHVLWLRDCCHNPAAERNALMAFVQTDDLVKLKLIGDSTSTHEIFHAIFEVLERRELDESLTEIALVHKEQLYVRGKLLVEYMRAPMRNRKNQVEAYFKDALVGTTLNHKGSQVHNVGGTSTRACRIDMQMFYDYCAQYKELTKEQVLTDLLVPATVGENR